MSLSFRLARKAGAPLLVALFVMPAVGAQTSDSRAGTSQDPKPKTRTIDVDQAYGSLAFRGTIERIDAGDELEFRTHLSITFRRNETPNRTAIADLRVFELVATVRRDPGQPFEVLHRDSQRISLRLLGEGETRPVPELTFRVPKSVVERAMLVGLSVNDGRLMWPITVNLK